MGASSAVRAVLRGVRGRGRLQALARKDGHRVRRPPLLPAHDEPPPVAPGRALRAGDHGFRAQRGGRQLRLLVAAGNVGAGRSRERRSRTSRSSRCATSRPTFHGDTLYGETEVLDKTPSRRKADRGVVYVETRGYKQDGTVVCIFRRKVHGADARLRRCARRRAAGAAGPEGVNWVWRPRFTRRAHGRVTGLQERGRAPHSVRASSSPSTSGSADMAARSTKRASSASSPARSGPSTTVHR